MLSRLIATQVVNWEGILLSAKVVSLPPRAKESQAAGPTPMQESSRVGTSCAVWAGELLKPSKPDTAWSWEVPEIEGCSQNQVLGEKLKLSVNSRMALESAVEAST